MVNRTDSKTKTTDKKRKAFRLTVSIAGATESERSALKKQNMPGYLYRIPPYRLDETVRMFSVKRENAPPKNLSKATQQANARAIFKGDAPFVACVSSDLNDARAKLFGAYAMLRWLRQAHSGPSLWHTVTGSFSDNLRDREESVIKKRPSQLVLVNSDSRMTTRKREKLRDLLEMYSDIPRLVTATGADPVSMMNYIGFQCHYSVWIRSVEVWDLG